MWESIQILKDCRKGCELLFIVTLLHLLQRNCVVKQAGMYSTRRSPFFLLLLYYVFICGHHAVWGVQERWTTERVKSRVSLSRLGIVQSADVTLNIVRSFRMTQTQAELLYLVVKHSVANPDCQSWSRHMILLSCQTVYWISTHNNVLCCFIKQFIIGYISCRA